MKAGNAAPADTHRAAPAPDGAAATTGAPGATGAHDAPGTGEPAAVIDRYARRGDPAARYSMLAPDVWQLVQERQRALLRALARHGRTDLAALALAEVGCGEGGNLLELLRMGFAPQHLTGIELLDARLRVARTRLPPAVVLLAGDAARAPLAPASQDFVLQYTVFSSLLDAGFQRELAQAMWAWLKPGGTVIWYDFIVDNPRNRDVRGVSAARVRALFPAARRIEARRLTLAPPLARVLSRVHPGLAALANTVPLLRTHLFAWIEKP